jgi:hypothetical protein
MNVPGVQVPIGVFYWSWWKRRFLDGEEKRQAVSVDSSNPEEEDKLFRVWLKKQPNLPSKVRSHFRDNFPCFANECFAYFKSTLSSDLPYRVFNSGK